MEFNERVDVPLDCVGHLYPRSSLWRSGGLVGSGVCDAGYSGALGACLQVRLFSSPPCSVGVADDWFAR